MIIDKRYDVYVEIVKLYNKEYHDNVSIDYLSDWDFMYNPYIRLIQVTDLYSLLNSFMLDFEKFYRFYLMDNIADNYGQYMELLETPIEILCLLHEIGHAYTLDMETDQIDKRTIDALVVEYSGRLDSKEFNIKYRQVYSEFMADCFAVKFLDNHWDEIQEIMQASEVYNIA